LLADVVYAAFLVLVVSIGFTAYRSRKNAPFQLKPSSLPEVKDSTLFDEEYREDLFWGTYRPGFYCGVAMFIFSEVSKPSKMHSTTFENTHMHPTMSTVQLFCVKFTMETFPLQQCSFIAMESTMKGVCRSTLSYTAATDSRFHVGVTSCK
jgi:hypothetical protein